MPQLHHHINIAPCVQKLLRDVRHGFIVKILVPFCCIIHLTVPVQNVQRILAQTYHLPVLPAFQCGRAMVCTQFLGFRNLIHDGIVVLQQPPALFHVVCFQNLLTGFLNGQFRGIQLPAVHHGKSLW